MIPPLVWVALGGAIGSMARYGLSAFVVKQANPIHFPWGTFSVNILGCMLAGIFLLLAESMQTMSQDVRLFIVTGVLGGFTTFSAFGIETLALIRRGELFIAFSYASLSVILGVCAMWLTYSVLKMLFH